MLAANAWPSMIAGAWGLLLGALVPPQEQFGEWSELVAAATEQLCLEGFHVDLQPIACQRKLYPTPSSLDGEWDYIIDKNIEVVLAWQPETSWEAKAILLRGLAGEGHSGASLLVQDALALILGTFAYYDPFSATVFLPEYHESAVAEYEYAVCHELAHVWQHQDGRFRNRSFGKCRERVFLESMLVEGEAELMANISTGRLKPAPDDEMEPRTLGLDYFEGIWKEGGWEAVRKAARHPPTSTEQVMHPVDKSADVPTQVALPTWPQDLGELEFAWTDSLGEWGIHDLMTNHSGLIVMNPRELVAGWDGDALFVCRTVDGVEAILWRSVWDREEDAEDFARAYLSRRPGRLTSAGQVVDWVWSNRVKLQPQLSALLSGCAQETLPDPADAISTERAETRL